MVISLEYIIFRLYAKDYINIGDTQFAWKFISLGGGTQQ